jgi:transposase
VVVVPPLKVRRFAGAVGQLAKTDKIDARLIARFAAAIQPQVHAAPDENTQAVKDLMTRRQQIMSMRTMEKNRKPIMPEALPSSIDRVIACLDEELAEVERALDRSYSSSSADFVGHSSR